MQVAVAVVTPISMTPYWPSAQADSHVAAPAALNCPHGHVTLVPSPAHALPSVQAVQLVRVVMVPPLVCEPAGHVLQLAVPPPLNLSFAPHGACTPLPSHA